VNISATRPSIQIPVFFSIIELFLEAVQIELNSNSFFNYRANLEYVEIEETDINHRG